MTPSQSAAAADARAVPAFRNGAQAVLVYKITNQISGKAYIGVTGSTLARRWRGHLDHAKDPARNGALQQAIRKYGKDAFTMELIVETVDARETRAVERGLIAAHGTLAPHGYNMTSGGEDEVGFSHNPATRERLRQLGLAQPAAQRAAFAAMASNRVGAKHTPETLERMSAAQQARGPRPTGWRHSEDGRRNMSNARHALLAGGWQQPPRIGYSHSEATKEAMRKPRSTAAKARITASHRSRGKLTEEKVLDIRAAARHGASVRMLASHYDVSEGLMSQVIRGLRWAVAQEDK